jgi:hypothetical protein
MLTKNRLEAFSDGVFTIAITLLVIEIRPPTPAAGESLARALWEQWPHYLSYFLSFLVLGVGVYTGAFLLSWLSPPLALAAHATMAAYYLTEQSSRLNVPAQSDPEADVGS